MFYHYKLMKDVRTHYNEASRVSYVSPSARLSKRLPDDLKVFRHRVAPFEYGTSRHRKRSFGKKIKKNFVGVKPKGYQKEK